MGLSLEREIVAGAFSRLRKDRAKDPRQEGDDRHEDQSFAEG
jgi:hypothetical protein